MSEKNLEFCLIACLVQLLHILMPSFRYGFLLLGSKIHFRCVHSRLNPFSSEFIFSLHISTESCLRVTVAFVCKLSQQFQFAANSADKNPDRGPYRKKLYRLRARDWPIRFEDLRFRPAEIL